MDLESEGLISIHNFAIIRNWDGSKESLLGDENIVDLIQQIGFDVETLIQLLNKDFPKEIQLEPVKSAGVKIEDLGVEIIDVNDRPLERLLVVAYPEAAHKVFEMTQFEDGGEVIFIKSGEAELTYAQKVSGNHIKPIDLRTIKVKKGDIILSTNTPNNWTKTDGFVFIYFVGNPNGPQRYNDIPKKKIPIKA